MWPWRKAERAVIGPGVRIQGLVESDRDLELAGEVHGNVQVTGALVLRSTARLHGDTRCASLQIEEGAVFSGTNRIDDAPLPPPAPAQPEPTAAPLSVLMEPVGPSEREVLGVLPRSESPAFYGGFSPAIKGT